MKSVMTSQEYFNRIQQPNIQRSKFDRSHGTKTAFNAGELVPVYVDEALPGDTFSMNASLFGRLSTPLKPIMDNIFIDIHFWSVPIRLVWENWQKFNGEQDAPGDSTNYLMPTSTSPVGGYLEGSLQDYMGLPTKIVGVEHRSDFLRAYNLIYNSWYRDENLDQPVSVPKDDGPDSSGLYILLNRGKRKDYFTSALPWAQKADPVVLPLGTTAPVYGNGTSSTLSSQYFQTDANASPGSNPTSLGAAVGNARRLSDGTNPIKLATEAWYTANPTYLPPYADLTESTAITVNALREAIQIQRMYERDARGGTRYTEILRAHFGVVSPDSRLQRPEFLGGGTINLNINPIAQTSASETGNTPQGNLAAMGTFSSMSKGFTKSFTEHEILIGIVSARADLNYQQGLNRMWSRSTRFDFYWPTFAHLGEQAILNKELYSTGTSTDDDVFGYQERYAEYRYKPSQITGVFRSNATQSLDVWHLAQEFGSLPSLNGAFIREAPPMDRILAINPDDQPAFILDCYFKLICARPMPTFASPGLMDHF